MTYESTLQEKLIVVLEAAMRDQQILVDFCSVEAVRRADPETRRILRRIAKETDANIAAARILVDEVRKMP